MDVMDLFEGCVPAMTKNKPKTPYEMEEVISYMKRNKDKNREIYYFYDHSWTHIDSGFIWGDSQISLIKKGRIFPTDEFIEYIRSSEKQ